MGQALGRYEVRQGLIVGVSDYKGVFNWLPDYSDCSFVYLRSSEARAGWLVKGKG